MNPHSYAYLILTKVIKTYNGEKTASSTNGTGKSGYLCLSPCTSSNSEWIKALNGRPKTLYLAYKRVGNTVETINVGQDFVSSTPSAKQLKERMDKWDYMKLKTFCTTREMVSKLKRPPTEWEKIFASYTSHKGLITRVYKESKILNFPKVNEPVKKWATELNRTFSKEEIQMAKKTHEKCLPSLAIKEMQIKTTLRFHLTPGRMASTKNTTNNKCWRGCGGKEPSHTADENVS
jgi:hypothetical protein